MDPENPHRRGEGLGCPPLPVSPRLFRSGLGSLQKWWDFLVHVTMTGGTAGSLRNAREKDAQGASGGHDWPGFSERSPGIPFPRFRVCICLPSSSGSWTWSFNEDTQALAGAASIFIGVGPWDTALEARSARAKYGPPEQQGWVDPRQVEMRKNIQNGCKIHNNVYIHVRKT